MLLDTRARVKCQPATIASSMPQLTLSSELRFVRGIGPHRAQALAEKGIASVGDLLLYLPFRYEDRVNPRGLADLRPGEMAAVVAEVRNSGLFQTKRMPLFQLVVGPLGGLPQPRLKCLWFHGSYLRDQFQPGQIVALYGKVETDREGLLQIIQPQFEILSDGSDGEDDKPEDGEAEISNSLEVGRIVPIYETAMQGK